MRYLAIPGVALLLLLHAVFGFLVWKAREPARAGRWVEASPVVLTERARIELQTGIAELSDRSRPATERFSAYRAQMQRGRELLIRSLDANPAQPDALATLAAIDYEISPADPTTLDETLERIEIAATLAPRVPRVQAQLGELLLRMGYADEALVYLARGVELDASLAERVVRMAAAHGVSASSVRDALANNAASLTALRHALTADEVDEYLGWVEEAIDTGSFEPTAELLFRYGDAALQVDLASRLADRLARWGPYDEAHLEASRLMQYSRAALRLDDMPFALVLAQQSQEMDPESHRLALFLGDTARAASQPELAIRAYRHGLGLLARRDANPRARAYLYRRIGEVHEDTLRLDLAYDAFAKALQVFPEEPYAKRRLNALSFEDGP